MKNEEIQLQLAAQEGWFYDYERFTLLIRTSSFSRKDSVSVIAQWNESKENLQDDLEIIHNGWVGVFNTMLRVRQYWGTVPGYEFFSPCLQLPQHFQANWSEWKQILQQFRNEYNTLIEQLNSIASQSQHGQLFVSHLTARAIAL